MEKIYERLYLVFCCNEEIEHNKLPFEKNELKYYNELEKILAEKNVQLLEDFIEAVTSDAEYKSQICFIQGLMLGIRLASGQVKELNL